MYHGGMSKPEPDAAIKLDGRAPAPTGDAAKTVNPTARPREIGGPSGLEPTRYGDWERNGRVSDF